MGYRDGQLDRRAYISWYGKAGEWNTTHFVLRVKSLALYILRA
jgi:hypothetical protein